MARYAISDIHGCCLTFKALLDQIQFSKQDELFLLGDYVDRGPDSKGVIDHIWALQSAGYTVHCLKGNHEQMMVDAYLVHSSQQFWLVNGGWATMDSFGVKKVDDLPEEYIRWMGGLPHYQETEGYLLVHAGLDFEKDDPINQKVAMLWIRKWYEQLDKDWLAGRIIVHGHTPTMNQMIKEQLKNRSELPVVVIDNGCFLERSGYGHLAAFDLDNMDLYFCPCIDR